MVEKEKEETKTDQTVDAEPDEARDASSGDASSGGGARSILIAAIVIVAAVAGFYSAFPSSRDPLVEAPELPPLAALPGATRLAPPVDDANLPPARSSPLDFLRGKLTERPTSVGDLIEESKLVTERLVEGFPDQPDALEIKGRLHFRLGESEEASSAWEGCIELNPNYAYAFQGLAQIAAKKGENDQAASLFQRAIDLNPSAFDTQIDLAMVLIDSNRAEEAVAVLEENIVADPRKHRGHVLLGMAHTQLEQYDKAKEHYEAAIKWHPSHTNAHLGLAKACVRLGLDDLSKEYFAKHRELMAGERELAKTQRVEFDDLETMCIDVAGTYADAARICLGRGHPAEAEILAKRAAVLDPRNTDCRLGLAFMYVQAGDRDEAIRMLNEVAEIEPDNPDIRLEIARLHVQSGQSESAEVVLRQLCEAIPTSPHGFVGLATLLIQEGREPEETLELARKALELVAVAGNYALLSSARELNGDLRGAVAALDEAMKLEPDNLAFKQARDTLVRQLEENPVEPAEEDTEPGESAAPCK